ncbi:hypothetical protein ACQKKG_07245 [Brevundimonas sp. NPDC003935]|uniref:hypothetical protein n=1 Tax=unclassified Brevundimonas TaxID=2622653 RepID=UPI0028A1839C|nr:hypothetical protein [Brevundimonas sp.]
MSGPDDDQRQGQRTAKVKKSWQSHFFNIQTAQMIISIGRLTVEIIKLFEK